MPAYIPLSIATFSIIGEKQARTLEPVLAAPDPDRRAAGRQGDRRARARACSPAGLTYVVVRRAGLARLRAAPVRRRDRPELARRRVPARAGGRAVVGRGRGHRQRAGQRSARRPADRRRDHRADRRRSPWSRRPGRSWSAPTGYLLLAAIILAISLVGPADRRRAVRPGGDPDPLALGNDPGSRRFCRYATDLPVSRIDLRQLAYDARPTPLSCRDDRPRVPDPIGSSSSPSASCGARATCSSSSRSTTSGRSRWSRSGWSSARILLWAVVRLTRQPLPREPPDLRPPLRDGPSSTSRSRSRSSPGPSSRSTRRWRPS